MKIQTVNQLISVFKDISTRHYQINGFGVGDNWENGTSEKMHPVLWINPTTATMPSSDNGYKTFEIDFEVRVFDLVNKDESNEKEVLSDCIDILKDIITEFKGHPYYVNSQLNIIDDINFEAFTEEFDEEVSGWVCEISLMTPVLTSFCGIPSAEITGFEFPGADCPDVNVLCPVFVEDVTGVYPIVVTTTGTTKEVSIVGGGLSDTFVISGEYDNGTLTLTRNDDVDVVVTGFDTGGDNDYTTSATLSGNIITFDRTDTVGAYSVDLTTAINSAPDKFVSSGAYDEINNKIVLTLNDASTVDIDTSAIGGGDSIYTADDTIGTGRVATLTDTLTFKDGTVNIQGAGTSTGSALSIYDNDTTPNKLWDFLDNGTLNGNKSKTTLIAQNLTSNDLTEFVFSLKTPFGVGTVDLMTVASDGYFQLGYSNSITGGADYSECFQIGKSNSITSNGGNKINIGKSNTISGTGTKSDQINIGSSNTIQGADNILIGSSNTSSSQVYQVVLGRDNVVNAGYSNTIGYDNDVVGLFSSAIGVRNKTTSSFSYLFGSGLSSTASGASIIGYGDGGNLNNKLVNSTANSLALGWNTTTPQHLFKTDGVNLTLPTSATGLSSGDLWNDGGTVKIV